MRYTYCDTSCDNISFAFDPTVTPLERWVVSKALHLLDLPTLKVPAFSASTRGEGLGGLRAAQKARCVL